MAVESYDVILMILIIVGIDESPVWPAMRTNRTKSQLTWTPVLTDEQHSIQHISTMLNKVFMFMFRELLYQILVLG